MIIVRRDQIGVFEEKAVTEAKLRALEFIHLNFEEAFLDDEPKAKMIIDKVFDFCEKFEIKLELHHQQLIAAEIDFGFVDTSPMKERWVEILTFPGRREELKVSYFLNALAPENEVESEFEE
jgi:hypothetical protein